jgi:hypothetical protein
MSESLQTALSIADALRRVGIPCVIAGGAARDIYHGREPKDYDIVVLDDLDVSEVLRQIVEDIPGQFRDLEYFGEGTSMRDCEDANLDWVVKFTRDGTEFDLIQFRSLPSTPQEVVEAFDCTLNMAWLDDEGAVQTHDLFPLPGGRVRLRPLCDYPAERVNYLRGKYEDYEWPDVHEIRAHPNYKPPKIAPPLHSLPLSQGH